MNNLFIFFFQNGDKNCRVGPVGLVKTRVFFILGLKETCSGTLVQKDFIIFEKKRKQNKTNLPVILFDILEAAPVTERQAKWSGVVFFVVVVVFCFVFFFLLFFFFFLFVLFVCLFLLFSVFFFCFFIVVFFSGIARFRPNERLTRLKMSEIILTGRKTQIKKIDIIDLCI